MKNKLYLLVILTLSLILAFVTGADTFYRAFIFILIVVIFNYILVIQNIKKIDSNFIINKETHSVGDPVKFEYILVNKSIIPIYNSKLTLILSKDFGYMDIESESLELPIL